MSPLGAATRQEWLDVRAAGAETCTAVQTAVNSGQALLDQINFKGTGSYLPSKGGNQTLRAQALALAKTLDDYNNGNLC
jgi:hypothetical protein